jgi:ATP-dependent DNA helicase RecG
MTATPIPRTLLLTLHGDLEVSFLREKPAHRKPVMTSVMSFQKRQELIASLPRALEWGHKIFWVCPLVEESETSALSSAQSRYEELSSVLGPQVGWIHGRMKGEEKEAALHSFRTGLFKILVTTTVVEVGVDVPDATLMIIEHAERYGLAQLHQLRGRIGRGQQPGTCILLYANPLSQVGQQRLSMMRTSHDGFELAEADLKFRGGGEVAGYKQSGAPDFKFADLTVHHDILKNVSDHVRHITAQDPELQDPCHRALKDLLRLFGHKPWVNVLTSG